MKKEELKELIEGIIIPNGQKGISADMLKSVLLEVADSLGEGGEGGSAGYTFFVNCDMGQIDVTNITESTLESANLLTPEQLEHNRTMFAKITEDINNGKPIPIIDFNMPIDFMEPGTGLDGMVALSAIMSVYVSSEEVRDSIGLPIDFVPFIYAMSEMGIIISPQGYGMLVG